MTTIIIIKIKFCQNLSFINMIEKGIRDVKNRCLRKELLGKPGWRGNKIEWKGFKYS